MKDIVILGGARDYHVMDWYRTIKCLVPNRNITFLTDLIGGEGFDIIVKENDKIEKLFLIDKFLFSKQLKLGNIWRNIFKLLVLPIQIYKLRAYDINHPNTIYHAQPMYYMLLCWLSGVKFIGTPQGSEILVRPFRSKLYKCLAIRVLQAADIVTIDSVNMQEKIFALSKKKAMIIQNGIDIKSIHNYDYQNTKRDKVVSIRGVTDLYRIKDIVEMRNASSLNIPIEFIYPFKDELYANDIRNIFIDTDRDLGRLVKEEMYMLLTQAKLVISIPKSDSSPRSVYEAIFLGACVAITYNSYFDILPKCMQGRIYIVNLDNSNWYNDAIEFATKQSAIKYIPSKEAIEMFDQNISMQNVINRLY
jgi:hypothetical protein